MRYAQLSLCFGLGLQLIVACSPSPKAPAGVRPRAKPIAGQAKPAKQDAERSVALQPSPDDGPLRQRWSQRQAQSCDVQLSIIQGKERGQLQGRLAWSRAQGELRIRAQLDGDIGAQRCRLRANSLQDALLIESWNAQLSHATTHRQPAALIQEHIQAMSELTMPMVYGLLRVGCAQQLALPPVLARWKLESVSEKSLKWSTSRGEGQTLWVDPKSALPVKRELRFFDPKDLQRKVQWTLQSKCKGA